MTIPGSPAVLGQPVAGVAPLAVQPGLTLSPSLVAPVNSQVVMVAGVMGGQRYLLTRERVEWNLSPNDPGHIVALGSGGCFDCLNKLHGLPKKVSNIYGINTTQIRPIKLDRGTPNPVDDLTVHTGEAWATFSVAGRRGLAHHGLCSGRQRLGPSPAKRRDLLDRRAVEFSAVGGNSGRQPAHTHHQPFATNRRFAFARLDRAL